MKNETEAKEWIEAKWGNLALLKLEQLNTLLREENAAQNLVSTSSLDTVWLRHIADSAQLVAFAEDAGKGEWLDIGTGAGFPGLVAAVLEPDRMVHLVEPRKRRTEWLAHATRLLSLDNTSIHTAKIGQVRHFPAAVITARAVARLDQLILWGHPFSTNETLWLLPKGQSGRQELKDANSSNRQMFHVKQSLTNEEAVILIGKGKAGKP